MERGCRAVDMVALAGMACCGAFVRSLCRLVRPGPAASAIEGTGGLRFGVLYVALAML